jgi:hypothetical protein
MTLAVRHFISSVVAIVVFAVVISTGALGASYKDFKIGSLKGKVVVQWWEPDKFVFLPDKDEPLTFKRSNGDTIVPGRMMTDLGSVPRPLWIFRNYSPMGYVPAFIVHDWLFHMKHCGIPGKEKYNHGIAATIMAEVVKTMMESGKVEVSKSTVFAMYEAVDSRVAKSHWDTGKCELAPTGFARNEPLYEFKLSF